MTLCGVFDRPKTVALRWAKNGEVTEWNRDRRGELRRSRHAMPPEAAGMAGALFLYRDHVHVVAGRYQASALHRQGDGVAPARAARRAVGGGLRKRVAAICNASICWRPGRRHCSSSRCWCTVPRAPGIATFQAAVAAHTCITEYVVRWVPERGSETARDQLHRNEETVIMAPYRAAIVYPGGCCGIPPALRKRRTGPL